MKKYHAQMVSVIAEIYDLYDQTKDAAVEDKIDKEFIENLAVTVELYFKSITSHAKRISG